METAIWARSRLGGNAALDDMGRRRRLDHAVTVPVGVFRAAGDDHPELRRRDVQTFRHILADQNLVQTFAALGHLRLDDLLDPLQMGGKALARARRALRHDPVPTALQLGTAIAERRSRSPRTRRRIARRSALASPAAPSAGHSAPAPASSQSPSVSAMRSSAALMRVQPPPPISDLDVRPCGARFGQPGPPEARPLSASARTIALSASTSSGSSATAVAMAGIRA